MSYTLLDNRDKDLINQDINKVSEQYNIKNKFGSSIVVNDSADFSIMGMKLFGKTTQPTTTGNQLFDIDTVKTNYINPGTGVEEANDSWKNTPSISCKANTTYTFSMKTKEFFQFAVSFYDSNKNFISGDSKSDYNITQYTFTTPSNTSFMRVGYSFKLSSGEVVRDDIMLNEGTEALPWEKYTGGLASPSPQYPQPLESKGKWGNLLENTLETETDSGVTATINSDKSVTLKGTATKTIQFWVSKNVSLKKGIAYKVNGGLSSNIMVRFVATDLSAVYASDDGNGATYTPTEDMTVMMDIRIANGATVNNTVYPQITYAEDNITSYRPYSGQMEIESAVYGKNLFGGDALADKLVSFGGTKNDSAKTIQFSNGQVSEKVLCDGIFKANTQYTIVLKGLNSLGTGSNLAVRYTDGTYDYLNKFVVNETVQFLLVTNASRTVKDISGVNYGGKTTLYYGECGIFEGVVSLEEFEPYKPKQSHISLVGDGLKGIPVTDASLATYTDENGKMWCADYVDCEESKLKQKIDLLVFDGSDDEDWIREKTGDTTYRFCCRGVKGMYTPNNTNAVTPSLCNIALGATPNQTYGGRKNSFALSGTQVYLVADYADVTELKTALAEKTMVVAYILAEPIETPLSADEIASYKALKSNYKVTSVMNDCDAEMEIKYAGDAYTSGLSDVINKSIDNKVGNIDSKVLVNGAEYGIDRIQIEKTDGQLQLVFRAADGTRKGAINFDLAETTTE